MNIKEQLLQGKPFSGRNGAFTGRVEPQSIEGDTLIVICDKDGTRCRSITAPTWACMVLTGDYKL